MKKSFITSGPGFIFSSFLEIVTAKQNYNMINFSRTFIFKAYRQLIIESTEKVHVVYHQQQRSYRDATTS